MSAWRWVAGMAAMGIVLAVCSCGQQTAPEEVPADVIEATGDTTAWSYSSLPEEGRLSFNLRFRVEAESARGVRLFFGPTSPENGFFVELGTEGVFSGRTRDGREIGRRLEDVTTLRALTGSSLVFERRRHRWALIADGRRLAGGDDPPAAGEGMAFGVSGGDGDARIRDFRFQPAPDVLFTDSFMRTPEDPTSWTEVSGAWEVKVLRDPLLSANAFFYKGSGEAAAAADAEAGTEASPAKPGRSVVGEWFWSDIEVKLACRPAEEGAVGMYVCYRGPEDYYLFRWTSRDSDQGVKQFVRRRGGVEEILAEAPGGCAPGQWYTLRGKIGSGWAQFGLDDAPVFLVRDEGLTYGQIGLHVEGAKQAFFDDVRVESRAGAVVDFARFRLDRWLTAAGTWLQVAPAAWDPEGWSGGVAVSAEKGARLLWGDPSWGDYRLSAQVGAFEKGTMGLCFRYLDDQNYYSVRWKKASAPVVQICKTEAGRDTVLAESEVREDGRPHELSVGSRSGSVVALLDGRPVARTADFGFVRGRVGLFADKIAGGSFSNVQYSFLPGCVPLPHLQEVFEAEKSMLIWSAALSDWAPLMGLTPGESPVAVRWHGHEFEENLRVAVTMPAEIPAGAEVGIALTGDGGGLFTGYVARIRRGEDGVLTAELLRDGLVAQTKVVPEDTVPTRLVLVREGLLRVLADDTPLLSLGLAADEATQRVGWYGRGCEVDAEAVSFRVGDAEVRATEWEEGTTRVDLTPPGREQVKAWWHRADFCGDARLDVRLAEPPGPGSEVGVILTGNGSDFGAGTVGRIVCDAADDGAGTPLRAELVLNGEVVETAPLAWEAGPLVLSLRRVGDATALCRDGRALFMLRGDEGVLGRRVAWYARGVEMTIADVDIFSDNVKNYAFNAAPTDWREGSGIWEVTNKWQCDPRWSFFSGRADGVAVLWNKRPLKGDFTIEYFIGNKMNNQRGDRYEYAKDMNITVCADGKDLSSGYSFLFGGFDNTKTCIYRGKELWCQPAAGKGILINQKGLHRKWYHVIVSRQGSRLEMRIDNELVLSKTDDAVLSGGHWALWTWNNGIMVSRVRVSAEEIGERDSPDVVWPETTQTIYPPS